MKVAIVCPYAWDRVGGVQSHVRSLATALRKREHDVTVIAPSSSEAKEEPNVRLVGRAVSIPANGSMAPVAFGPLAAAGIRRELRDIDPDVVHVHEPLIPSLSLLALWNSDVPAVGTFHAAAESSVGYRVARPVLDRAAKRLAVRAAVSPAAQELAQTYFPGDFVITPNGIDVDRFERASAVTTSDAPPSVLFFSRIEKRKGLEVLIEAMSRLDRSSVQLIVGGAGPQERSARSLARSHHVEARFLGRVNETDVPGVFRSATIYCAPGLGGESFGIVLLEAMAAGTPVVCSDLPGFRAVAEDVAALVPPGDVDALAKALRDLLDDTARQAEMARAGSARAARYDWNVLVGDVERLYETAVSKT